MDGTVIVNTLLYGLATGCVYILLATGLNIVFGVMKLANFAHGQLLMIGAYLAWTFAFATGTNAYISLIVSMVATALLALLIERFTFRKVMGRDKLNEIFVSLGLIFIIENLAMLIWGDKFNQQIYSPFMNQTLIISQIALSYDRIVAMVITVAILISLGLMMKKTKIGLAMRATSQKSTTSALMGINVNKVYMFTFALGAALAAAAGTLYGVIFSFNYTVGTIPTIIAFAVIILGGLGSIKGAVVGGLLYGITEQLAILFLGGIWANAIAFVLLIVVLVIKPTGIFGEKGV